MADQAWRWYVALDGGDLDGLTGDAGLMRFDWPSRRVTHRFYDGLSGGHNVSLSPDRRQLILGNFCQQVVVVDAETLEVTARQSTMRFEECDFRLRSNTHHLWLDDDSVICAVGDHLYLFRLDDLEHPEKLGPHLLRNPHELRWSSDRRYILMGDLGLEHTGARQVGIFDRQAAAARVITLPGTVWHVTVDPTRPVGYAATYSYAVESGDYVEWTPAYTREYVFEIDLVEAKVVRTWSAGAPFPIHLNSDLDIWGAGTAAAKLYVASGGSHAVVEIDLADFASSRKVTVVPSWWTRLWAWRQRNRNLIDAFARRNMLTSGHQQLQTLLVTGWRLFDGVYCARVSPDGRYLVAGNRGYNYVRVMERSTLATVYETQLPRLPSGLHLGMHHSELVPDDR